jgi:prepilin-type processing-associated H-X9-DG protein
MWRYNDDSFEALFPQYLKTFDVLACPNTDNVVRTTAESRNNAPGGPRDDSGGHSYELRDYMWRDIVFTDGVSFLGDPSMLGGQPLKAPKRFKDLTRVSYIMDADDASSDPTDMNNWPNPGDNHGEKGFNIAYMDAHVEWTQTGKGILEAYMGGYYYPGVPPEIMQKYGLLYSGNRFTWQY